MNPLVEFIQQYGTFIGILAAITTVLGVAFAIYKASHDRHVKFLNERIDQLERELAKRDGTDAEGQELRRRLDEAEAEKRKLQNQLDTLQQDGAEKERVWQEQLERLQAVIASLTDELEKAKEELARRDRADRSRTRVMKKAMELEGKVWERNILQGTPRFRPLSERHAAVISVLNLKGGVGKTTVTAHLGAALSAKGYNVLLVDLDLQGSLSGLFLHETILVERRKAERLLQHFLTNTAERRKANLLEYCIPIFNGKSAIVPTADSMAYAELNLTMQW